MRCRLPRFERDTKPNFFHYLNLFLMKANFKPPKWLLFSILTIFVAQLFGQNANNSKSVKPVFRYAVKAYLDVSHKSETSSTTDIASNYSTTTRTNQTLFSPMLGVSKVKKNGVISELSLTHFKFLSDNNQTTSTYLKDSTAITIPSRGAKTKIGSLGVRWEWNFPLFKGFSKVVHKQLFYLSKN